ncbi:hypothetical protein FAI41_04675 [Acetobacteraceae bacterium]|nr:hypothetical protein FAI41_04675 [Acetobacteraceae bacterium]
MNKKDIIERLNQINLNQKLKFNQINLPSLQISNIPQTVFPTFLEKLKELFQIIPPQASTDFALLSREERTAPKIATKTILQRKEIHEFVRQTFPQIKQSEAKKAPEKTASALLPVLNHVPALKIQKSASSDQRHAASFLAVSSKNPEKKSIENFQKTEEKKEAFSFSASRQGGKQAFLTKEEKPILQRLNQNIEINRPIYFHLQSKKTDFKIKERSHFEKIHSFSKEKTFLPLSAPQKQAAQSPHLLQVMAPVLFPKPERDALFSILKDIQNKVSGTKKAQPSPQQIKQCVPAGRNGFYATLRKTTR